MPPKAQAMPSRPTPAHAGLLLAPMTVAMVMYRNNKVATNSAIMAR